MMDRGARCPPDAPRVPAQADIPQSDLDIKGEVYLFCI